ncbi:integumentary mucin A.1-like [Atheta coriaria]|uniref:integumentary mucin A.1-like n=1 Tax=Dalotia coriaria TaxID=877792 RepID=UPI0031F40889
MFLKAFYVFSFICFLSWGTDADTCEDSEKWFKCSDDDINSFEWGGLSIKCPSDRVCNSKYILTKDETTTTMTPTTTVTATNPTTTVTTLSSTTTETSSSPTTTETTLSTTTSETTPTTSTTEITTTSETSPTTTTTEASPTTTTTEASPTTTTTEAPTTTTTSETTPTTSNTEEPITTTTTDPNLGRNIRKFLNRVAPRASKCEPCVPPSVACGNGNKFKCDTNNSTKFELNGDKFECPDGFKCNDGYKHGCFPCYRPKCENKWTCGPGEDDVTTDTFRGKCVNGSVCKTDKFAPCDYCVSKSRKRSARQLLRIIETF